MHVYGGVDKYGRTPLFVTMRSSGIKAKSNAVTGYVYLTLLHEHPIPACAALIAKTPLAEAQHEYIVKPHNAKAHACKMLLAIVSMWLASNVMDYQKPDLRRLKACGVMCRANY